MCGLGDSARPPYVSTSASAARGSWRRSAATSPLSRSSDPRKRAASRSRLMIEDHLMTPPVSQIASGAPDPIKLGARKMGGNLGSVGTRETAHYAISHGACVRFRTNCAIPEGQPADLRHHVPACATRVAQRISLGMPRHAVGCGGRTSGAAGRYPGVIEEAFLALRASKPLYLAGILGGATRQAIDAIEGGPMVDTFCAPTPVNELYLAPPVPERDPGTGADRLVDRAAIWETFGRVGRSRLAEANRLSLDENGEFFTKPALDRVIQLVLTGIARLQARR